MSSIQPHVCLKTEESQFVEVFFKKQVFLLIKYLEPAENLPILYGTMEHTFVHQFDQIRWQITYDFFFLSCY